MLRFLTSPIEIKGDGKVERIVLGRNELVTDESGRVVAKDTGAREELPVQLVVRSVGYRGVPTPGCRSTSAAAPSPIPMAEWRAAATNTSSGGSSEARPG
ncbi:NADPH-ferredoxin reductase fprA domain protein [Mycobacterium xenopi 3993]|nr:NADPH-ferredoxin reductase fprA domain protein [Mycobacterium xenopi 3993]